VFYSLSRGDNKVVSFAFNFSQTDGAPCTILMTVAKPHLSPPFYDAIQIRK